MGQWSVEIKSYPDLSLAAMRLRMEPQYRLWLLARHLDPRGSSRIQIKALRKFLVKHRICDRRTLHRNLARKSIFWITYGGTMKLRGVLKIAADLDVEFHSCPVMLPLAVFSSMQDLRALFVASWFAEKPRTIAMDTLATLTGRSRRTIIRYLESPYVTKTPNAMSSALKPSRHLDPWLAGQGYFHTRVKGKVRLVKRMPNTYTSALETAPRGLTGKPRRRNSSSTEQTSPSMGESKSPIEGGACSSLEGLPRRLYFQELRGTLRALERLRPGETVYTMCPGQTDDLGFQLWNGWTSLEEGGCAMSH